MPKFSTIARGVAGWLGAIAIGLAAPSAIAQEESGGLSELTDFTYWVNLCQLQFEARDYANAKASCEQAIVLLQETANRRTGPDPVASASLWAKHASILLALKSYPEAVASTQQVFAFEPQHSEALAYQCEAYAALDATEAALDACNLALDVDRNWGTVAPVRVWYRRGEILSQLGQNELALATYDRALGLEPNAAQILLSRCTSLVILGESEAAIVTCASALNGNDRLGAIEPADAYFQLGLARANLGHNIEAIAAFEKVFELQPDNGKARQQQGMALQQLNRNREALVAYQQAATLLPKSSLVQLQICTVFNQLGEYEMALAACQQSLQGDGDWGGAGLVAVWNQQTRALVGQGKFDEALGANERARGLTPNHPAVWSNQAAILWRLNRHEEAIAAANTAIGLDDSYIPAWFNRGVILQSQGNYAEALATYNQANGRAPDNAEVLANRSASLWHLNNFQGALDSAKQAIALDPSSSLAWYNQALAYLGLADYASARLAFEQVLALNPNHPDALAGYGIVLARLGQTEAAIVNLERALQLDPEQAIAQTTLARLATADTETQ
ncbi:tetratricopeptide repeat protein [Synechococcus sp. PCC 7336]|uniref:tetratricopeptide repeat protein n=1 Tax=Synechococcus sp. PCC 7336 TaxID=195250 RepID=UPI00036BA87D|nr:tetratricopeptide repeat protein [Synechococcus sp. PCC 7336]